MQTSRMEISNLKILIQEKMYHSYIKKNVKMPEISNDKLYMLTLILNNTALPEHKKKNYIVSVMLVQMALDTHDLVPEKNHDIKSDYDDKSMQLNVLAGDYYSGLYYFILSEISETEMVQTLASAIREINEYKMQLYYKDVNSFESFMHIVKKLESLLIVRVAAFAGETDLSGVAGDWLITRRLMEARNNMINSGMIMPVYAWSDYVCFDDYDISLHAVDSFIHNDKNCINTYLDNIPAHLSEEKTYLKQSLRDTPYNNRSIAEEG